MLSAHHAHGHGSVRLSAGIDALRHFSRLLQYLTNLMSIFSFHSQSCRDPFTTYSPVLTSNMEAFGLAAGVLQVAGFGAEVGSTL
jgi:hypothetical protein